MNYYFNISVLFSTLFLFFIPVTNQINEGYFDSSNETKNCGLFRNRKSSDALFQDVKILSLNCDSTFSYRYSNCIHPEISSGTWTLCKDTVKLSVNNNVKRLAGKEHITKAGYRYLDLDNAILVMNDLIIIWERSDRLRDTLYGE